MLTRSHCGVEGPSEEKMRRPAAWCAGEVEHFMEVGVWV